MSNEHITSSKMSHVINLRHISYFCVSYALFCFMHRCMCITVEDSWKSGIASIRESFKTAPQKLKQDQASTRRKKERRGVIEPTAVSTIRYKCAFHVA